MSRAIVERPRALDLREPRLRGLAELATVVTEAPWELSRAHLSRAHAAGLSDAEVLHAIALAAFFGHVNRIADAVAVPLDYEVARTPPATDASVPPLSPAPATKTGRPALDLALRPETARALAEWRSYSFYRDAPLSRRQRTYIARLVARWLGDGGISPPEDLTGNPLDDALRELAETITLAPWRLSPASFERLREAGFDDAALFDACATASAAGVFSRIEVAIVSLSA